MHNQTNLKEKAEQVKHMGLIYSQAKKAVVWLGSADASLETVKVFLDLLNIEKRHLQSFSSESRDPIPRRSKPNQKDPEFMRVHRMQHRITNVLRGLLEIFSRPYWERVWVIPEISKASNVESMFGQFQVSLDPLLLASRNIKDLPDRTRTLLKAIVRFRAQEQEHGELLTNARMSLYEALVTSRYSLATDPRDKVYALLGMTSDGSNLVPLPTYAGSVEEIFYNLTNALIRSQQPGNVVLLANWVPLQERFQGAAKWCVDWAELGYHLPPWLTKMSRSIPKAASSRAEFDGSRLVTKEQYVATLTQVQGTERVALPSPARPVNNGSATSDLAKRKGAAYKVMKRICSDLLNRLAPGFRSASLLSQVELTDALARLIRDVNKQQASADYDMSCVEDVLDNLGSLSWRGIPIWEWARQYNSARASDDDKVHQLPPVQKLRYLLPL